MTVPLVVIVGRPNVGKSSLFNALAGRRIAIVDPTAGVTRDRISAMIHTDSGRFEVVDTGGIGVKDPQGLTALVAEQIQAALRQAQVILFVVDGRTGFMPLDKQVADQLRAVNRPVIVAINKCDTPSLDLEGAEFYKLGHEHVVCVSAQQKRGLKELVSLIGKALPGMAEKSSGPDVAMKVAIVGQRNTGKSTFVNSLAQSPRVIVSETPGTTRDSIDVQFQRDGKTFVAIDTAGVRRKQSRSSNIEFYSTARAERSIRRSDVVLLFFDPAKPISKVDKQLADYILKEYKPAIFLVNKWDLVAPTPTERFGNLLRSTFPSLAYVPIAFITAKSGRNVFKILNLAQNLYKQAGYRAGTGDLNRVVRAALTEQVPPIRQNRRPKVYYATQVDVFPPTIVIFTNGPELFDITYQRFLLKAFRDHLPYSDVPIKLYLRRRQRGVEPQETASRPPRYRGGPATLPARDRPGGAGWKKKSKRRREPELWTDI